MFGGTRPAWAEFGGQSSSVSVHGLAMRRLMMICLSALSASTACLGFLFLYALVAPTNPLPSAAVTSGHAYAWTGPGEPRVINLAGDVAHRAPGL
jgi:hypothetical protein